VEVVKEGSQFCRVVHAGIASQPDKSVDPPATQAKRHFTTSERCLAHSSRGAVIQDYRQARRPFFRCQAARTRISPASYGFETLTDTSSATSPGLHVRAIKSPPVDPDKPFMKPRDD